MKNGINEVCRKDTHTLKWSLMCINVTYPA